MRLELKTLYENGDTEHTFDAEVGFRRTGGIRFASKPSVQKLLVGVKRNNKLVADHLVMTVGKEIPAVPLTYSRIMPGNKIKFIGKIFKYVRKLDGSTDYGIKMLRLLDSKQKENFASRIDNIKLKELWLEHKITSQEYLKALSNGRR